MKFLLSIKDFLTFRFLMFSVLPLVASSIVFFGLVGYLINLISNLEFSEESFNFFLGIYILHAIQIAFLLLTSFAGSFLALHLSVFFALFIVSFLTPLIVKELNFKHYNYIKSDEISFAAICAKLLKIFIKFLLMFFFALIFYTIPVLNFFAPLIMSAVMFYLYFHFIILDVASCVLSKNDFLAFNPYKLEYVLKILVFYLICNIPVIGFFLQVFFVIYLAHTMFAKELGQKSQWLDYK